jgi:hypothetical protein
MDARVLEMEVEVGVMQYQSVHKCPYDTLVHTLGDRKRDYMIGEYVNDIPHTN